MEGEDEKNIAEDDVVTKVDTEMTELIISFFKDQEGSYELQSEEMAKERMEASEGETDYTVVFDEIDGTHHLIEKNGPYGPIVGIAKGQNPEFGDIVAAGYLNLASGKLYHAYRGEGAYIDTGNPGKNQSLSTSGKKELERGGKTSLLIDQGMLGKKPSIAREAWKHWCNDYGSQGQHYALVAKGDRDVFITGGHSYLESKPVNSPEEAAGMYLLVEEAGGKVTDWDGETVEEEKIGMKDKKNHDIIAAATPKLARETAEKIIPEEH